MNQDSKNSVDDKNNILYKEILKNQYVKKISEKTDSNIELVKRLIRSYLSENENPKEIKNK